MRDDDEIEAQIDKAIRSKQEHRGTAWPGMTYEMGVENALRWVLGDEDSGPMDEDE